MTGPPSAAPALQSESVAGLVRRKADPATYMDPTIKDFEAALAELDTIVKKLEEGDLPLESSLQLYERGVQLSRFCHARLEEAERRIEILNERGELKPAPSALADEDEGAAARARGQK